MTHDTPSVQRPPLRGYTETGYDAWRDGLQRDRVTVLSCGHSTVDGYKMSHSLPPGRNYWCHTCRTHRREASDVGC